MKPARRVCVHVSQLPLLKSITGYIGMKDFRGLIIEAMQSVGFFVVGGMHYHFAFSPNFGFGIR
jgi:hypothetical protein